MTKEQETTTATAPVKRGRGRPKKNLEEKEPEALLPKEQNHPLEDSDNDEVPEGGGEEEIWDFVSNIKGNGDIKCCSDGCNEKAIAIWASNMKPNEKWNCCENCQENDFGGWPDDFIQDENGDHEVAAQGESTTVEHKTLSSPPPAETNDNDNDGNEDEELSDGIPAVEAKEEEEDFAGNIQKSRDDNQKSSSTTVAGLKSKNDNDDTKEVDDGESGSTKSKADTAEEIVVSTAKDGASNMEVEEEEEIWGKFTKPSYDLFYSHHMYSHNCFHSSPQDLKKILSISSLSKEATIKCGHQECLNTACCIWVSNLEPNTKWYSCIDCQEMDFEGWPENEDLPIKFWEGPEHPRIIAKKCSQQKDPVMPNIPLLPSAESPTQKGNTVSFLTPPPNRGTVSLARKSKTITPSPSENGTKKLSSSALAMHKKWQEAAEGMGGKDARIVVAMPAAKKLIFDLLYEAFTPMNITQVFKGLKAVVPQPVLSNCLKQMACNDDDDKNPFDDSDGEEEEAEEKSSSTEPYAGSLHFKPGRNASSSLYYVDYTKLKEMDHEERNALANDIAIAKGEETVLRESIKSKLTEASKLLSEPTNEEAAVLLENEESAMVTLEAKLSEARALKVNEKHRQKTKKSIQHMAAQWRKRKRMCMEFLNNMEEMTDGTISVKKCLSGDGQICLDSDEVVAKGAIKLAKAKQARAHLGGGLKNKKRKIGQQKSGASARPGNSLADPSFVAVVLDSQMSIRRVHVDDDEN